MSYFPWCSGLLNSNAAVMDAQPPPITATLIGPVWFMALGETLLIGFCMEERYLKSRVTLIGRPELVENNKHASAGLVRQVHLTRLSTGAPACHDYVFLLLAGFLLAFFFDTRS